MAMKKSPGKKKLAHKRPNYDLFEYRLDKDQNNYYLFNPWTGEVIQCTEILMRSTSLWIEPDKYPNERAQLTVLYPEYYASRRWGCRVFTGWNGDHMLAATHISAVGRGFLARQRLRKQFRMTWEKVMCEKSRYYYFYNAATQQTCWTKPLLAFPDDILVKVDANDKESVEMHGYSQGPFIKAGIGKKHKIRCQKASSPEKPVLEKENAMIDIEGNSYRVVASWIDNNMSKLAGFAAMRLALAEENWSTILEIIANSKDNSNFRMIQLSGVHAMSRMTVALDTQSGLVTEGVAAGLEYCLSLLTEAQGAVKYGSNVLLFALHALVHVLCTHPGRVEFFNVRHLESTHRDAYVETEDNKDAAIEEYLEGRLDIFCKYLLQIPVEVRYEQTEKYSSVQTFVTIPTKRAVDMTDLVTQCLELLAHERHTRELMAQYCGVVVLRTLETCIEESSIVCHCLKSIYNFCFMCQVGQAFLVEKANPTASIQMCRSNILSDDEAVGRECRRVELALAAEGWRGTVESIIEKEMALDRLDFADSYTCSCDFSVGSGVPTHKIELSSVCPTVQTDGNNDDDTFTINSTLSPYSLTVGSLSSISSAFHSPVSILATQS